MALRMTSQIQVYLMQLGMTIDVARNEALLLLYQFISVRAGVTAFEMDYVIGASIVLVGVIPALFLPFGRAKKAEAAIEIGV
jgi:hypothetical protein